MSIEFFEDEVVITLGEEALKNWEDQCSRVKEEYKRRGYTLKNVPKSDKLYFTYKKEQQLRVDCSKNLVSLLSKSGFVIATEKLFVNKLY